MKGIDRKGWKKVLFGEVCRNLNITERAPLEAGIKRYVGLEHIEPEKLHIRSWGDIAEGTTFTKKFGPGHVLFGKRRAYQKKAAVADFTGICSGDILVLEAIEEVIDARLLPFVVQADRFFEYAVQTSAGSLSPRTKFQDLAKYNFLLPPKEEQMRLAELLWAGDDIVRQFEQLEVCLETTRRSYQRETFATSHSVTINDIAIKVGSGKTPLGGEKVYTQEGVLFLRSQNVLAGELSLEDCVYISSETHSSMRSSRVMQNDVLLNITGASIGRTAVFNAPHIKEANVNQHVCIIRTPNYKPTLLCEYLNSAFGQEQIEMLQTNGNRQGLNFQNLRQLSVPDFDAGQQEVIANKIQHLFDCKAKVLKQKNNNRLVQKHLINQIFSR
jgi:type I restriction enzyme S subunit